MGVIVTTKCRDTINNILVILVILEGPLEGASDASFPKRIDASLVIIPIFPTTITENGMKKKNAKSIHVHW